MRRNQDQHSSDSSTIEAALNAMDVHELRAFVRETLPSLEATAYACFVDALLSRSACYDSGFVPPRPSDANIEEIEAFAKAARQVGFAEPTKVDAYLRQATHAFLAKDYRAAFRIFRELLIPLGVCDFHVGQDETLDEVLTVDPHSCASQYVVSMYMTSTTRVRAQAVRSAIEEMDGVGFFWQPLREMERTAVEALPDFDDFIVRWKELIEASVKDAVHCSWDSTEDRWLREAVQRTNGPDGLAKLARASKQTGDLRAWCRSLVEAKDWKGALNAYEESARLVSDDSLVLGDFLDGAALAEQQIGSEQLPTRLEQAWRMAPSMPRLRRWLGCSAVKQELLKRVSQALVQVPKQAHRQQALLFVLGNDVLAAARLLASANGLGWSIDDHPGHLLFPLFLSLIGNLDVPHQPELDFEVRFLDTDPKGPQLETPSVADLIRLAGIQAPEDPETLGALINSMRTAAYKRIAGVTQHKRRRHYEHAASLALACAKIDRSTDTAAWFDGIRKEFRRFPALQRAFDRV